MEQKHSIDKGSGNISAICPFFKIKVKTKNSTQRNSYYKKIDGLSYGFSPEKTTPK